MSRSIKVFGFIFLLAREKTKGGGYRKYVHFVFSNSIGPNDFAFHGHLKCGLMFSSLFEKDI
jgi:hypothetical protein